jgi:SAM-dependent methyltransferase
VRTRVPCQTTGVGLGQHGVAARDRQGGGELAVHRDCSFGSAAAEPVRRCTHSLSRGGLRGIRAAHGLRSFRTGSVLIPVPGADVRDGSAVDAGSCGSIRARSGKREDEMTTIDRTAVDAAALGTFHDRAVADLGAALSGVLVHLGDRLGLYRAMAGAGPMSSTALAVRTGTSERYVREWLAIQAAGGYLVYDPVHETFELPAEHARVLADEDSAEFMGGAFEAVASSYNDHDLLAKAFRTGAGVRWKDRDQRLFSGIRRVNRPAYAAHLVDDWLRSLDGIVDTLRAGGRVADLGCGQGESTILMAAAFPRSQFFGFDVHEPSIADARARATQAGVADRTSFALDSAQQFPGSGYDLVCMLDCLHAMGDPVEAARHARVSLAPEGALLLVEPLAGDRVEQNLTPQGRVSYGLSAMVSTPSALAQEVGLVLGAQAGERHLAIALRMAGFSRVRRAAQTTQHLVIEARP